MADGGTAEWIGELMVRNLFDLDPGRMTEMEFAATVAAIPAAHKRRFGFGRTAGMTRDEEAAEIEAIESRYLSGIPLGNLNQI